MTDDNPVVKTYFVTDKLENKFPPEFVASRNKRYIVVQDCKCLVKGHAISDIELHADFIKRNAYCDHFVMFCNDNCLPKYKKYEYTASDVGFKVWFTDTEGNLYKPHKEWIGEDGELVECDEYVVHDDYGRIVYELDPNGDYKLDSNGDRIPMKSKTKLIRNQWEYFGKDKDEWEANGRIEMSFKLQLLLIY